MQNEKNQEIKESPDEQILEGENKESADNPELTDEAASSENEENVEPSSPESEKTVVHDKSDTQRKAKATEGKSVREQSHDFNRREITRDLQELKKANSSYVGHSRIGVINNYFGDGEHLYDPKGNQKVHITGLDVDEFKVLAAIYLKPHQHDNAYKCLRDNRWVIIRGRPQIGKRSAALYMAYELCKGVPDLYELSPETNLKEWISAPNLVKNGIYFIDSLAGVRAQEVQAFDWRALKKALAEKNSYLVVSVREGVQFVSDMPTEVIFNWVPPDNPGKLVKNHLLYLDVPLETVDDLLSQPLVVQLIEGQLSPGRAKLLAESLNAYVIGEIATLDEALSGFTVYDDKLIRERLSTAKDDEERAFRIALAVFNGARYRSVEEAADKLAELLKPSEAKEKEEDSGTFGSLFDDDDRIERAEADIVTEYPTDNSLVPIEIIRLKDPDFQPALLSYVWRKFGKIRPLLLKWLKNYGSNPYRDMRMHTSAAVAFLAQHEFETVVSEVMVPWADERSRESRQTLSYTFASLVSTEQYSDATLALLRRWSLGGRDSLVWAAARAYGVIGPYYPREAMDRWLDILLRFNFIERHVLETLRIIVDDEYRPLFDSLFDAFYTFFILALTLPKEEFVRIYKQTLLSLKDWIDIEKRQLFSILIAIPLFVDLMELPIATQEHTEDDENNPSELDFAPALLVLAGACAPDDDSINDIAWLLSVAIRTNETRSLTINSGLYTWIAYVEKEEKELAKTDEKGQSLYESLKNILQALVNEKSFNHRRWHREIGRPFENWAKYSKNPVSVAGRLVKDLNIQR